MVHLFLADIDGCLSVPYQPWDLARLSELRALTQAPHAPRFGLCTGRPYSYAEAIAQALDVRGPVLFESGAGWFDPVTATTRWHAALTGETRAALATIRDFYAQQLVPAHAGLSIDHGKRAQAGLVAPRAATIEAALPAIEAFVAEHVPSFHVFHTDISVDVVPPGLTKAEAMAWVAAEEGVPLDALAFIGDTNGDLGALRAVGHDFAPSNATPEVRAAVTHPLSGAVLEGTLQAFRWCMSYNAPTHSHLAG